MTQDDAHVEEHSALMGGILVEAGQVVLATDPDEYRARRAYVEQLAEKLVQLDGAGTVAELAVFAARILVRDAGRRGLDPVALLESFETRLLLDGDDDAPA